MLNREVFYKDPTSFTIPNDGVTIVQNPETPQQWDVLRYELEHFVCSGEYEAGMVRVLSQFLANIDEEKQPAAWVSGFYGSGKSHFVRVLQYLWQDITFPEGAQARSLVNAPADVKDLLRELSTAGNRAGGLWSAAGTLSPGSSSIRLSLLAILFQSAGLPSRYDHARFVLWLKQQGIYETVRQGIQNQGEDFDTELQNLFVSPVLAKSVLAVIPDLGTTTKDVLAQFKAQFTQKDDITDQELKAVITELLTLRSTAPGKWPLTLLVLDELQQSIGNDSDRILQVQNIVQACSSSFKSHLLVVATGQAALGATPQLMKLQDRFTVRVMLSDNDVQSVVRNVVLRKAEDKKAIISQVLDNASGEINRHLAGTKIAPTMSDASSLVPDYPLLPARRRFWESLLRAIDRPGTAAQLRTQLRMVHEATRSVAAEPVGTVVPADLIYDQQKTSMLQSGVLLPEVAKIIADQDNGTEDGNLKSRLCVAIFLIGELPTEGVSATGVRATAETLADLLVEYLPQGSTSLRQRIPSLLEQMAVDGLLMSIEGEYRLQTRESREWERDRRGRYQKVYADEARTASDRATEFHSAVSATLKPVKLVQGASKTPRSYAFHFGLDTPSLGTEAIPIWVRDEWSVSEKTVREDAQEAGIGSPVVFVLLPRYNAEPLRVALADHAATKETLDARPAQQLTSEGINARGAMETRLKQQRVILDNLVGSILTNARVFQGGGNEVSEGNLRASVENALNASLVRQFMNFTMADDTRWGQVIQRAHQGAKDPLSALGYNGDADQHLVCREVMICLGNDSKTGLELRKMYTGAGYGWPQDAVDGALYALLAGGYVEAHDKGGNTRAIKEIAQSQIGVMAFRCVTVFITVAQRMSVRSLIESMGLRVNPGAEAQAIPQMLQKLADLADGVGGEPPLPMRPSKALIQDLLSQSGNEQFLAVFKVGVELQSQYQAWTHLKELQTQRSHRWPILNRLQQHASGRLIATRTTPHIEAIRGNRSLLSEPDPVQPLITDLSADLRQALQEARHKLEQVRDEALQGIKTTEEWQKLGDDAWRRILQDNGLAPVAELAIGTEEQLLYTLDTTPLRRWEDWIVAVPERLRHAREQAARLLEPKSLHITPKSTTLHSVEEVETYLADLRNELMKHIRAGNPVII